MGELDNRSLTSRLFHPDDASTPLDLPGHPGIVKSRDIYEHNPPGTSRPAGASAADMARAEALVQALARWQRNTNITASLPAHTTPMPWSQNIDKSATIVLGAAVSDYQTVLTYAAPNGRYGRIAQYGFDVAGGYTYDGSILWRFVFNNGPVQDLTDIAEHRGSMSQPCDTYLIVPQAQRVDFQVRRAVVAGATSTIQMKMKGWDWLLRKNDEGTKASVTAG